MINPNLLTDELAELEEKRTPEEDMIIDEFSKLKFVEKVEFEAIVEMKCIVTFKTRKETYDEEKMTKLISKELEVFDKLPKGFHLSFDYIRKEK